MNMLTRTTGLCVALLALSACESADQETPEDPGQQSAAEETAPEEGVEPNEGSNQEEDSEGGAGDDAPSVPQLAEIEGHIWDVATSQDSVSISGEVSASVVGWDHLESDENSDQHADGAERVDITAGGHSEGEGSVYQVGDVFDYVIFGDDIYQSVDSVVAEYELSQPPEGTDVPASEDVREAFEAEGSWANVGPVGRDYVETPADLIANFDDELRSVADVGSLSEAGLTGESSTVDGEHVWVYRSDQAEWFIELVVAADEEEPLLRQISYDLDGDWADVDFRDWNEAEAPQEPAVEEVIEPDEVQDILETLG